MTPAGTDQDRFVIIMPVLNGTDHLQEQLDSIADQTDTRWHLLVSDDGSTDDSTQRVDAFAARFPGRVERVDGPQKGLTANIVSLLHRIPPGTGPIALCDQDDIWLDDRLARDRAALSSLDPADPGLVCRRTLLCDANGTALGLSPDRPRPVSFANALVQNIASGNTMSFNRALLTRLAELTPALPATIYHDWWIYQIATGIGGRVLYDPEPTVRYRQHKTNLVGVPRGLTGQIKRALRQLSGNGPRDYFAHLEALNSVCHHLTPDAQSRLRACKAARTGSYLHRLRSLRKSGLYRQSKLETLLFCWSVVTAAQ